MKLLLKRIYFCDTYTVGKIYIDGIYFSDTLEDANRDNDKDGDLDETKVFGETCIPFGTYELIVNYSPKFKRFLPRLLNVPSFDGILIHNGRTAEHSHGCILVGRNTIKGQLTDSTNYMNLLVQKLKLGKELMTIEIV